jgi:hypothetical protein
LLESCRIHDALKRRVWQHSFHDLFELVSVHASNYTRETHLHNCAAPTNS